jgi:hypothetical protein
METGSNDSLMQAMQNHCQETKMTLSDIFAAVAFARGAADDVVVQLNHRRTSETEALQTELKKIPVELSKDVSYQLLEYKHVRETNAIAAVRERRAVIVELRKKVEGRLREFDRGVAELRRDRIAAGRVWKTHAQKFSNLRRRSAV